MFSSIEIILINAQTRFGSQPALVTRCIESDQLEENIYHPANALRTAYIDCTVSVDARIDLSSIYITGHMPFVKEVKKAIIDYRNVKGNALSCQVFQWGTAMSKSLSKIYAHYRTVDPVALGAVYLHTEEGELFQLVHLREHGFGLKLIEGVIVPSTDLPKVADASSPNFLKSLLNQVSAQKAIENFWENSEHMDSAQIAMHYGEITKAEYALVPVHCGDKIIELFNNPQFAR